MLLEAASTSESGTDERELGVRAHLDHLGDRQRKSAVLDDDLVVEGLPVGLALRLGLAAPRMTRTRETVNHRAVTSLMSARPEPHAADIVPVLSSEAHLSNANHPGGVVVAKD